MKKLVSLTSFNVLKGLHFNDNSVVAYFFGSFTILHT